MKPNLILHIGSPKTGTSSIQKTLINNKDLLSKHGYHYLECLQWHDGAHHELAFSIRGLSYNEKKKDFKDCLIDIKNEISTLENDTHSIIISSELFFYDISNNIEHIAKLFSLFNKVLIFTVLRDPIDYLTSLYKQMVKDPNDRLSSSPEDFYSSRKNIIDYQRILKSYSKVTKKHDAYIILPYSSEVVSCFMNDALGIKNYTQISHMTNPTMDGAALKIKLEINKKIKNFDKNLISIKLIDEFIKNKKIPFIKLNIFKLENFNEINKDFIEKNSEIIETYSLPFGFKEYEDFNFFTVSDELLDEFWVKNKEELL